MLVSMRVCPRSLLREALGIGSRVSCVRLSERDFQVVYPFGMRCCSLGVVHVLLPLYE